MDGSIVRKEKCDGGLKNEQDWSKTKNGRQQPKSIDPLQKISIFILYFISRASL